MKSIRIFTLYSKLTDETQWHQRFERDLSKTINIFSGRGTTELEMCVRTYKCIYIHKYINEIIRQRRGITARYRAGTEKRQKPNNNNV